MKHLTPDLWIWDSKYSLSVRSQVPSICYVDFTLIKAFDIIYKEFDHKKV